MRERNLVTCLTIFGLKTNRDLVRLNRKKIRNFWILFLRQQLKTIKHYNGNEIGLQQTMFCLQKIVAF